MIECSLTPYVGKQFTFEDDRSIKIIETNLRDFGYPEYWVIYEVKFAKDAIPKRLQMSEKEFIGSFSHLFFPPAK